LLSSSLSKRTRKCSYFVSWIPLHNAESKNVESKYSSIEISKKNTILFPLLQLDIIAFGTSFSTFLFSTFLFSIKLKFIISRQFQRRKVRKRFFPRQWKILNQRKQSINWFFWMFRRFKNSSSKRRISVYFLFFWHSIYWKRSQQETKAVILLEQLISHVAAKRTRNYVDDETINR